MAEHTLVVTDRWYQNAAGTGRISRRGRLSLRLRATGALRALQFVLGRESERPLAHARYRPGEGSFG